MERSCRVYFEPDGIDISVPEGTSLLEAAISAGVPLRAVCGGAGTCGTCKIILRSGDLDCSPGSRLSEEEYGRGLRQACQSRVISDVVVEVVPESRMEEVILSREAEDHGKDAPLPTGWRYHPIVNKFYLELSLPSKSDNTSDLSRLLRELEQRYHLANPTPSPDIIPGLAQTLRQENWRVTVSILQERGTPMLINVEPGDTRGEQWGLAIDIGTTSVRGQLLDLHTGTVIAQALDYNAQRKYGADVISRIAYAGHEGGLKRLQDAIVTTINQLIERLLTKPNVDRRKINLISIAANTTMVHLLLGLDPEYIRLSPYVPTVSIVPVIKANSIGLNLPSHVYSYILPAVSSYVGGDIVAGILGTGVYQRDEVTFYLDIGTNGEMVVGNKDWLACTSCSAGPTFEGGGIKHGMLATSGAIEESDVDPLTLDPAITTIGQSPPRGICGSGLINVTAAMLRSGIINPDGKFSTRNTSSRLREGEDGYEYVLAWAKETAIEKDITITEADIANLIRSKAAVYAGYETLLKSVGVDEGAIEHFIISGTFGNNININNATAIGLLPNLPREKFVFVGNGSLLGARLALYSSDLVADSKKIATMMTNIELSENVEFMNSYIAALFLPHTNQEKFPRPTGRRR